MTKAELLTAVEGKTGYVATLADTLALDSIGTKQKRFLVVETLNADGTKGITNVFYVHDTQTDEAWFYNVEPVGFQKESKSLEAQAVGAIENYCKTNFNAHFLLRDRIDAVNKWAVVEVYTLNTGKLEKKNIMVFKQGANPITHLEIV